MLASHVFNLRLIQAENEWVLLDHLVCNLGMSELPCEINFFLRAVINGLSVDFVHLGSERIVLKIESLNISYGLLLATRRVLDEPRVMTAEGELRSVAVMRRHAWQSQLFVGPHIHLAAYLCLETRLKFYIKLKELLLLYSLFLE